MKSKLKLFMAMLAAVLCFGTAVACDEPADPPAHEHTYATEWTTDATHHWHAATCEHTDEVKDKAEHTLTEKVITAATYLAKGSAKKVCSCGYETAAYELEKLPKVDPTFTAPTGLVGYLGETLADISLPEGFSFVLAGTTAFDEVGAKEFDVTYTAPNDTEGKFNVMTVKVTIMVDKARPEYTVPTTLTATFGDLLSSVAFTQPANGEWTWKTASDLVGEVGERVHVAVFTPSDANFATVEEEITITVAAKELNAGIQAIAAQTYTGSKIEPTIVVKDGETTLTLGEDYTVAYGANVNVADGGTVTVTFKGNYSGTANANFEIAPKTLTSGIQAIAAQTYTGDKLTPAITIKDGETTLNAGADYETPVYGDNVTVAQGGSVSVALKGNYAGTLTAQFVISPAVLDATAIDAIADVTFNNEEQEPELTINFGTTELVAGTDYDVTYANNINAGEASAIVTFKGNFDGTATATFNISKKDITAEMITVTGSTAQLTNGAKPEVTVSLGATADDFTLSYANNLYAGDTATVTVTANAGSVNFTGSAEKTFTVTQFAGATAKTMNASVATIDAYNGQLMEVKAVDENDNRGLWYKAELKEEGLYVVAKAVADNYIHDDTYVSGMQPGAQASRHTYFEFFINNAKTQVFTYGGEGSINEDRIETRQQGNSIFDFIVWRTVENEGVTTGGKYTHVVEGFVSAEKLTEADKYVGVAYSSAFNPTAVLDTDGQTVILPRGHIEKLTVNSGNVTRNDDRGYFYGLALNKAGLSKAMTITANGIELKKNNADPIVVSGNAANDSAWAQSTSFNHTYGADNFVQVIDGSWTGLTLYDANGNTENVTVENFDPIKTYEGNINANYWIAWLAFENFVNGKSPMHVLAPELNATGLRMDAKGWNDTATGRNYSSISISQGNDSTRDKNLGAKLLETLVKGEFRVVIVRDCDWVHIYATISEDGSLVWISTNPSIAYNSAFYGVRVRQAKSPGTLTYTSSLVYGTTDYESVLSTYYAD